MVQPVQDKPDIRSSYSRQVDHPWLWVGLIGGSVAVHAVLVIAAFPFFDRLISPEVEMSSVPVEWVELPPVDRPPPIQRPLQQIQPPSPPSSSTAEPPPQKVVGDLAGQTQIGQTQPQPAQPTLPLSEQPAIGYAEPRSAENLPAPTLPQSSLTQPAEQDTNQTIAPAPPVAAESTLSPSTDPINEFPTIPIDRAPPDLSERLNIPTESIDPETLAQTNVNPEVPPVVFIAFLTILPLAADESPSVFSEITHRNISDPATSTCSRFINPEILRSLETPIAADLLLTPTGEVAQLELEPTDNSAYNELADCILRSWNFTIALPSSQPTLHESTSTESTSTESTSTESIPSEPPPSEPTPNLIPTQVQLTITRQPLTPNP
jgi:hypothetical protein